MIGVAVFPLAEGKWVPGVLALVLAFAPQFALRLFLDAEPREIVLAGQSLRLRLDSGATEIFDLPGSMARRLELDEIEHLSSLAERGGLVLGTGSFDSRVFGEVDLYATDLRNAVLLKREQTAWIVTPDAPDAFLAAIAATITAP
jgi:hypothetical protein